MRSKTSSRRLLLGASLLACLSAGTTGCVPDPSGGPQGATGGQTATGGNSGSGGAPPSSGGAPGSGGASSGSGGTAGGPNEGSGGAPISTATGGAGPAVGGTGGGGTGNGGSSPTGSGGVAAASGGSGGGSAGTGGAANTGGAPGSGGNVADGGVDAGRDGTAPVDQAALPAITLYLAGDSTVMTYAAGSAQEGWGQELGQFFISKVTINNQAVGGASVQTFMYSNPPTNTVEAARWSRIHSGIKAGDYLLVQFGANDSGFTADRHVDPPDFQLLLGRMVDAVKAKQATPILVTPSALQEWSGGRQGNVRLGPYATAMRNLALLKNILVADLNARSVEHLNMIGQTATMQLYINGDKAHFTKAGAVQMARFVAEELRRIGSPLAAYLK